MILSSEDVGSAEIFTWDSELISMSNAATLDDRLWAEAAYNVVYKYFFL